MVVVSIDLKLDLKLLETTLEIGLALMGFRTKLVLTMITFET